MNALLRHQYDESRRIALDQLAYMLRQVDEFAEQHGGPDMDTEKARIYQGRRQGIIRLAAFPDRAHEYIEDLEHWIGDLIQENRRLSTQQREAEEGWKAFFPRMTGTTGHDESAREHQRFLTHTRARMAQPDLF